MTPFIDLKVINVDDKRCEVVSVESKSRSSSVWKTLVKCLINLALIVRLLADKSKAIRTNNKLEQRCQFLKKIFLMRDPIGGMVSLKFLKLLSLEVSI